MEFQSQCNESKWVFLFGSDGNNMLRAIDTPLSVGAGGNLQVLSMAFTHSRSHLSALCRRSGTDIAFDNERNQKCCNSRLNGM